MEKDRISMSQRERDVLKVMSLVLAGKRTQVEASRLIGRSQRQVRRLQSRLQAQGDVGVIHRLRGRPSNNASDPSLRQRAMELCRGKYAGFGPTLAAEKLSEDEAIDVSVETLRGWMLAEGLWDASGDVTSTAAVGSGVVVLGRWCRRTRASTTGWKDVARCWRWWG